MARLAEPHLRRVQLFALLPQLLLQLLVLIFQELQLSTQLRHLILVLLPVSLQRVLYRLFLAVGLS